MGLKYKALAAQIKRIETESGIKIPLDVGADYMPLLFHGDNKLP